MAQKHPQFTASIRDKRRTVVKEHIVSMLVTSDRSVGTKPKASLPWHIFAGLCSTSKVVVYHLWEEC
jgi:hypothetical protein